MAFSAQTQAIREVDIAWFARIVGDDGVSIPADLKADLPAVLWFFQMGVIFFWPLDESPEQTRTQSLLELSAKSVVGLIRLSSLPLMRPLRRTALELIGLVKEVRAW